MLHAVVLKVVFWGFSEETGRRNCTGKYTVDSEFTSFYVGVHRPRGWFLLQCNFVVMIVCMFPDEQAGGICARSTAVSTQYLSRRLAQTPREDYFDFTHQALPPLPPPVTSLFFF